MIGKPLNFFEIAIKSYQKIYNGGLAEWGVGILDMISGTDLSVSESFDDQEIKFIEPVKYTSELDFQYVDFVQREHPEESPTFREAVSTR